jgi:hypothetical protein
MDRKCSRHTARGEGRSKGGSQLGPGPANPNSKVLRHPQWRSTGYSRATLSGAAQATAAPPLVAQHKLQPRHPQWRRTYRKGPARPTWQAEPRHYQWRCYLLSRATVNGAAKRVIRVKLFRRWFIFYDCIKFRLILSKSPVMATRLPRYVPHVFPFILNL